MNDDELEQVLRDLFIDLCAVLQQHGFHQVRVGAMLRLVGVEEERAAQHDDEWFEMDQEFQDLIQQRQAMRDLKPPPGTQLH